jgi:large subunit ribosomal protein L5
MSYFSEAQKKLMKDLDIKNVHAVPRIRQVVLNIGVGKQRENSGYIEAVIRDLAAISGQKPRERRARKAVAGFNVRRGNLVGYTLTLRGKRMEDFVQRFVHITLPRVRDFRGIPLSSLDGHGNVSVGLTEHLAFPEIHSDKTDVIFGVQVTFVTTATDNQTGEALFRSLGFPFSTEEKGEAELMVETAASRATREKQKHTHSKSAPAT